ncbi:MAG: phosphoribosylglycinamide formyltransferase [Peptostreptococcaceae bacterium]|jgi:phosphoribosylglycinamide formyltransferase-1|nr:phosphoribosylglycinamide formyltransferase [Peptostreptococcaceae bacterium]
MLNIAVLISGSGSNLQRLIDECKNNNINGNIKLVISNKENVYGLQRAKEENIKNLYINDEEDIKNELKKENIDLIVLAGFLKILSKDFIKEYKNKIINIHPSLIPSFCGKGYYGMKVHEAVIKKGVKISGATVHFVNEIADEGPIIMQKTVEVDINDSKESVAKKVLEVEHEILPYVVKQFCEGNIIINEDERVDIIG